MKTNNPSHPDKLSPTQADEMPPPLTPQTKMQHGFPVLYTILGIFSVLLFAGISFSVWYAAKWYKNSELSQILSNINFETTDPNNDKQNTQNNYNQKIEKNISVKETTKSVTNINNKQPASVPAPAPKPTQTCTKYTITKSEFKSDKCYTSQDYNNLVYYLALYESAESSMEFAETGMDITCESDWEEFEDNCEEYEDDYEQAKKDKEEYKNEINEIIAKGK